MYVYIYIYIYYFQRRKEQPAFESGNPRRSGAATRQMHPLLHFPPRFEFSDFPSQSKTFWLCAAKVLFVFFVRELKSVITFPMVLAMALLLSTSCALCIPPCIREAHTLSKASWRRTGKNLSIEAPFNFIASFPSSCCFHQFGTSFMFLHSSGKSLHLYF